MPHRQIARHLAPALLCLSATACAIQDHRIADQARRSLLGLSEVELQSCLGVPDQHASFGATDILTYYATSSSSMSYSLPIVGGLGFSNGGYCHATFRLDGGRVSRILYSGEKNATLAPDAYCAPIVRSCLAWQAAHPAAATSAGAGETPTAQTSSSPARTIPPGAANGAPQPGASVAGFPANTPTATPR